MMMFAKSVISVLVSSAVATRMDAQVELGTEQLHFDCEPLSTLIECEDPAPKHLGAGGFGAAWLVKIKELVPGTEDSGGMVVLKTFFNREKDGYLTQEDYDPKSPSFESLQLAKAECDIAMKIHASGEAANHKGTHHLVHCYSHNIEQGGKVPLYTLMDFAGSVDLDDFTSSTILTLKDPMHVMRSIFKQILLGLDYLARLTPSVTHHDLKPANVVIKTNMGRNGEQVYSAHIIDYGGTLQAGEDTKCKKDGEFVFTPVFSPPEVYLNAASCRWNENTMYDPAVPGAFDVWSAAMLWWDMFAGLNGAELIDEVQTFWCANVKRHWCPKPLSPFETLVAPPLEQSHDADELKDPQHFIKGKCREERALCGSYHKVLEPPFLNDRGIDELVRLANHEFFYAAAASITEKRSDKGMADRRAKFVEEMLENPEVRSFVKYLMANVVTRDAKERATAADLLQHEFLRDVEVPDLNKAKERQKITRDTSIAEAAELDSHGAEVLFFHEEKARGAFHLQQHDEDDDEESTSDDSSDDSDFDIYDVPSEELVAAEKAGVATVFGKFARSVKNIGSRWLAGL